MRGHPRHPGPHAGPDFAVLLLFLTITALAALIAMALRALA